MAAREALVTLVALAAAALLAGPVPGARAANHCEEPPPAVTHPSCIKLAALQPAGAGAGAGARCVSVRGQAASLALVWGSGPARAAAAALLALLRHALRYRRLRLAPAPHRTADLARQIPFAPSATYTDLAIALSTAWEPEKPSPWSPGEGKSSNLAGPRLSEFGSSPVPARCELLARLSGAARARPACARHHTWTFYANASALRLCDFIGDTPHPDHVSSAEVMVVSDCEAAMRRLQEWVGDGAPLRPRYSSRAELLAALRDASRSLLFVDYGLWSDESTVTVVECERHLDTAIGMRVADVTILEVYAPHIIKLVYDFNITTKSLREILDREANGEHIEEAACKWGLDHKSYLHGLQYSKVYNIMVYICEDPDTRTYIDIVTEVEKYMLSNADDLGFVTNVSRSVINCSDEHYMSRELEHRVRFTSVYSLLGAVTQAVAGAPLAAATAAARRLPLLLVGAAPESTAGAATWRVAGRPRHVAAALQHLLRAAAWGRLALLADPTALAADYSASLRDGADFAIREFYIPARLTGERALEALRELEATNSRIVFVNTDSDSAAVLLTAALDRRMSYADGFVWILRDWRPNNTTSVMTHFTISLWSRVRGRGMITKHQKLQSQLDELLSGRQWPPLSESIVNAILTLADGYKHVFREYPDTRYDLHTKKTIRLLDQQMPYKERSIEEATVYVDEWRGASFRRLAVWRANASSGAVSGPALGAALPRDDGRRRCWLRSAEPYDPDCYDAPAAGTLLALVLLAAAALLWRRAHRRLLARIDHQYRLKMIAERLDVAAALEPYLVKRSALRLEHELGAGRFGSVRMARLCAPRTAPRHVAAKALRDDADHAEESEFLREACTIASLDHEHVVRLVGVCIEDGPPLVLMELALFGDLLGYLRSRRHLVASAGAEASEEAAHVSARALTRLAREAACALSHLAERALVHRDVRAANCLVDARRSLKLADFGLARRTTAQAGGAAHYACRRRGLFPVLWMAPESLAHGVFSPASDVWAFGVLLTELVTLGARPYGAVPPPRVMEYVTAGGQPPLPALASPDTCWLARQCWARAAEARPSAALLADELAARPAALRPALLADPDDADSGFGESPSTELLPQPRKCCSPQHSLDRLQILSATP